MRTSAGPPERADGPLGRRADGPLGRRADGPLGRRAVLGLLLAGSAAGVAGCDSDGGGRIWIRREPHRLSTDERCQGVAIAASRQLRDAAMSLAARSRPATALVATLAVVAAHHVLHLAALGDREGGAPLPAEPLWPTPTPNGGAPVSPTSGEGLAAAQIQASALLLSEGTAASGPLSTLLARISAAQYVHARLLAPRTAPDPPGPLGAPTPSTAPTSTAAGTQVPGRTGVPDPTAAAAAAVRALQDHLAAEHAAVYAYGVLTARSSAGARQLAEQAWAEHEVVRGRLRRDLLALGAEPVAAEPAYAVGGLPPAGLALLVEAGSAAAAAAAVAVDLPWVRAASGRRLAEAAWRRARWGVREALPGG